jgi:hypothetical protein
MGQKQPKFEDLLGEVHIQSLKGLGASYRMKGYFQLKLDGSFKRINFKGIAFGGHYGGHNVSVELSPRITKTLQSKDDFKDKEQLNELLAEVQRRILNGEMKVEYEKLKQGPEVDPFGNISS